METNTKISGLSDNIDTTDAEVALINLAYARSGDKGDHANIGVIARKACLLYTSPSPRDS